MLYLETVLRRLLRPLIGYLMKQGWGYIALRDLIKRIYVEEALHQHATEQSPTDSQISFVTGINRREIKRLREELETSSEQPLRDPMAGVNLAARVVGTWGSARKFLDQSDNPLPLSLRKRGNGPFFDDLLRAAKVDIRGRTVINELLQAGVVEKTENDKLHLLQGAYIPKEPDEKMLFLAANVSDHLRASLHNLLPHESPYIERALFHNNITPIHLDAVRSQLSTMADQMLRRANEILLDQNAADTDTAHVDSNIQSLRRLRLGVYYYETDADDQP